ncbi:hypothetical protein HIK02_15080 [Cronobacter sakazakii]|uniref:hypothetical protein n=1 Tax=Cronobacter sakazakii TaxID=28141 RepID=UPI001072465F|nr:hypothetical protein [Cronobacter sakazakii]EMC4201853.1 hypothetical protein [Cronobacter sakazakii]KAB0860130.1 hypothetical protein FZI13_00905 [Cronobacter sakazakii]MBF4825135.1 hypothetical protein [Cronobacter sakazakii]HDK7352963.1 hypothetical protein [Cronobacter sakazakii]
MSEMIRHLKKVRADEIGPNTVLSVFDEYYRVRKVNYHGDRTTLFLQEESEPLSYFVKNDIIEVKVPNGLEIDVEVKS